MSAPLLARFQPSRVVALRCARALGARVLRLLRWVRMVVGQGGGSWSRWSAALVRRAIAISTLDVTMSIVVVLTHNLGVVHRARGLR